MRTREAIDFIIILLPEDVDPHAPSTKASLDMQAMEQVVAQYPFRRSPKRLDVRVNWVMTDDPEEVMKVQPAHDCNECRAGNDLAFRWLLEHPGRYLALGNLFYTEFWED